MSAPTTIESWKTIRDSVDLSALFLAAGTTIFVYDWFLTLADEYQYLFKSPLTIVKTLYVMNRVLAIVTLTILGIGHGGFITTSIQLCQATFVVSGCLLVCLFAVWNWVIAIRVHALYGLNPRIKWFLAGFWVAAESATLYLSLRESIIVARHAVVIPDIHACIPGPIPHRFWVIWIPSICYEVTLFGMAMAKLLSAQRLTDSSLHRLLLRDGTLYFMTIMSLRIANIIMFARGNIGNVFIVVFFSVGLGSVAITRLVLNLRSWYRDFNYGDDGGVRYAPQAGAAAAHNQHQLHRRPTHTYTRQASVASSIYDHRPFDVELAARDSTSGSTTTGTPSPVSPTFPGPYAYQAYDHRHSKLAHSIHSVNSGYSVKRKPAPAWDDVSEPEEPSPVTSNLTITELSGSAGGWRRHDTTNPPTPPPAVLIPSITGNRDVRMERDSPERRRQYRRSVSSMEAVDLSAPSSAAGDQDQNQRRGLGLGFLSGMKPLDVDAPSAEFELP